MAGERKVVAVAEKGAKDVGAVLAVKEEEDPDVVNAEAKVVGVGREINVKGERHLCVEKEEHEIDVRVAEGSEGQEEAELAAGKEGNESSEGVDDVACYNF